MKGKMFMKIEEISINEFNNYAKYHPLSSHYQTINYALLMSEQGYSHELIGYKDQSGKIYAVSLILIKKIKNNLNYGYAPKGFIIDYYNQNLLQSFTRDIINYYKKRNICFIKINPELAISEIDIKAHVKRNTPNIVITKTLQDLGYIKLKNNLYFESIFPRFNGIISLKDFNLNNTDKNTRNKIRRSFTKGLEFEIANRQGLDILQKFIKKKRDCNEFYYKDYYNSFNQNNMIDVLLVSINPHKYLINSRRLYETEMEKNNIYNQKLKQFNTKRNINKKMMSDKKLLAYINDINLATNLSKKQEKVYIAGALVIRFQNRIHILISGFDKKYKSFDPNYFLHYSIIEYYKKHFDYLDLNGMTGNFEKNNPYYGLNQFKIGFQPKIYEFIGEYDLPIKPRKYEKLRKSGTLAKLFNKTNLKKEQ